MHKFLIFPPERKNWRSFYWGAGICLYVISPVFWRGEQSQKAQNEKQEKVTSRNQLNKIFKGPPASPTPTFQGKMISHSLSYSHSSDDNQKSLQCNVYFVWQIIHLRTPVSILIVPQAGWTQFTMQIRPSCGKTNFKEGKKWETAQSILDLLFSPRSLTVVRRVPNGQPQRWNPFCTQQILCIDRDRATTSCPYSQSHSKFQRKEGWITSEIFYS